MLPARDMTMPKKKVLAFTFMLISLVHAAYAVPIREEGQKFAAFMTIAAILVSLPAFISLYLHLRKTNLGRLLYQPFLAMFIGFFGIMLNSIVDIWRIFQGFSVDNISMVMGVNRALSSVLIAAGCVILFFNLKHHGLLSISYYQKKKARKRK